MTIATAIFFPARATLKEAVAEAVQNRPPRCELATDGKRVAWLPRIVPGWFPINAAVFKEAA
jgi:hypothetical protein